MIDELLSEKEKEIPFEASHATIEESRHYWENKDIETLDLDRVSAISHYRYKYGTTRNIRILVLEVNETEFDRIILNNKRKKIPKTLIIMLKLVDQGIWYQFEFKKIEKYVKPHNSIYEIPLDVIQSNLKAIESSELVANKELNKLDYSLSAFGSNQFGIDITDTIKTNNKKKKEIDYIPRENGRKHYFLWHGERIIFEITFHADILKTMNATYKIKTAMLNLRKMIYLVFETKVSEKDGKTIKEKAKNEFTTDVVWIKSIKQVIGRALRDLLHQYGHEVCNTSYREKLNNSKAPITVEGYHPLGTCLDNDQGCIVHQIFGSLRNPSNFWINILPVGVNIPDDATINDYHFPIQRMGRGFENRSAHSMSGHALGNFMEEFLTGDFSFQLDLTELYMQDPVMAGAIIYVVRNLARLGRGFNSGYGHIQAMNYKLSRKKKISEDKFDPDTNSWICIDRYEEEFMNGEVQELIKSFESFLINGE